MPPQIAPATREDASEVAEIYAHYVLHGTATFELVPPDAEEIAARMARVLGAGAPWLTARGHDGALLGYAYAAQFKPRAGYRFACEDSIYVRPHALGKGIGTRLLGRLIAASESAGFRQMIAGIAGPEPASVALHARAGFVEVARLRSVGRKHGRWLDVVYMQRPLGEGDGAPPDEEPR
jgi:L-amino acid N-acyltransferase YncA